MHSANLGKYSLGDAVFQSLVVETRLVREKQVDFVTILDRDLNLYSFVVNEAKKCFDEVDDVTNIGNQLKIDAQWLIFNNKTQIDFETYKNDYRLTC